jgi:hypothetical protein
MKIDACYLRELFKYGYEAFESSRIEAAEVWDLYHNRHYTEQQLNILKSRGQPAESFNVVKMFARMLVGYYSSVVNTAVAAPINPRDVDTAAMLTDVIDYTLTDNRFDIEGDQIKLGGLVSGLLVSFTNVVKTGNVDAFKRPINRITCHHVPDDEVVLDPDSVLDDYSDARWLHRYKWLHKFEVIRKFGRAKTEKLFAYENTLNEVGTEFEFKFTDNFQGRYREHEHYLIVHTVIEDENNKRWSIYWSNDTILSKKEITLKKCKWPYRVQKLHSSNKVEYYGIFRDVKEAQHAINQAILKIQLMVNTEKAFVQKGSVEDLDSFTTAYNRVAGVIEVLDLAGIKVEKLNGEIQQQYIIIDKALDRIQRVLGINDSFLGMAYASDSGRKVKLQKDATIMSLRYVTARIEGFYRSLGEDIAKLAQQYYTANQILMIVDEIVGQRWIELNKPMVAFSGKYDAQGQPIYAPILLPLLDPANGDPMEDEEGNIILAPVSEAGTDFSYTDFQITVQASSYNDEDEKAQLLIETVLSGNVGQMMSKINPAGFFKMSALAMKSMKTKYSPNIVEVLDQTAMMLSQNPQANAEASQIAQGNPSGGQPMSKGLKLPTNTNEGVE